MTIIEAITLVVLAFIMTGEIRWRIGMDKRFIAWDAAKSKLDQTQAMVDRTLEELTSASAKMGSLLERLQAVAEE